MTNENSNDNETLFKDPVLTSMFLKEAFKVDIINEYLFLYRNEVNRVFNIPLSSRILYETFCKPSAKLAIKAAHSILNDENTTSVGEEGRKLEYESYLKCQDDLICHLKETAYKHMANMLYDKETMQMTDVYVHVKDTLNNLTVNQLRYALHILVDGGVNIQLLEKHMDNAHLKLADFDKLGKLYKDRLCVSHKKRDEKINGTSDNSKDNHTFDNKNIDAPVDWLDSNKIYSILYQEKEYDSWKQYVPKQVYKSLSESSKMSKEIKRQEIIFELFNTERNFLKAMVTLKQVFQDPLYESHGKILSKERAHQVFANLDEIVVVSHKLYTRMKVRMDEGYIVKSLQDIFEESFECLKVYATFCSNQTIAQDEISKLRNKNEQFCKFVKEAERNPKCAQYKYLLNDLMVMPIQRITRYTLFLNTLLSKSGNPVDKALLDTVIPRLQNIVSYVENRTGRVRNAYQLKKIHQSIICENGVMLDILDAPREFLKGGLLYVKSSITAKDLGNKNFKTKIKDVKALDKQSIILLNDMVIIGSSRNGKLYIKDNPLLFKNVHVCDHSGTVNDKKSFFLIDKQKFERLELCCFSPAEKKSWIREIQNLQSKSMCV